MRAKCCEILALLLCLLLVAPSTLAAASDAPLDQLRKLRAENHSKISWLDQRIQKRLQDSDMSSNEKINLAQTELEMLSRLRKEYRLRQEFYDRLSFVIETHYKKGKLKDFLGKSLIHLAKIELQQGEGPSQLWKTYGFLGKQVKSLGRNENPLEFISSFVNFNGLSQPIDAESFIQSRNYTNGRDFEGAKSSDPEQLGELIESKQRAAHKLFGKGRWRDIEMEFFQIPTETEPQRLNRITAPIKVSISDKPGEPDSNPTTVDSRPASDLYGPSDSLLHGPPKPDSGERTEPTVRLIPKDQLNN